MKNKLLITSSVLSVLILFFNCADSNQDREVEKLREKHQEFLDNSPFKESQYLTRTDRKAKGLPPNAYYEQLWELTMDPNTGRPMPERLEEIRSELAEQRRFYRGVSGENSSPWVSRGPNDQGGRTRGIMFDPNDVGNTNPADDYTRVFAGGVSGGLWVNEDITNANSSWTQVDGMQANISVTTIISDPNDSNVFYIGSGESFTFGQAVGRGVWKSTDAGATWQNIFGGYDSFNNGTVNGIFYINDIVARNVGGNTELYIAVANARYGSSSSPSNFHSSFDAGVYKSVNGGANWNRFNITFDNGNFKNPCDLEIDINNNIWFTTTDNVFGDDGGDIYRSTNGTSFSLIRNIPSASRTELEVSSTDANRFWVAAQIGSGADLFTTTDAFSTITTMLEPNDADNGIDAADYTRRQAYYDLPIEADQGGRLYVGGIDLFVTSNNGNNWTQISKWSNNPNLNTLNVPFVHADQHAIVFRPGSNGNQVVFGTDGGVYYSNNIVGTVGNPNAIQSRNKDYVTTQFYSGTIDGVGGANGDDLAGGTQDNGTQVLLNGGLGANPFVDPVGGDGGFTEIDDIGDQYLITTYPFNNHRYISYPSLSSGYSITTGTDSNDNSLGSFINEGALDKNLNILYSNVSRGNNRAIERTSNFTNGQGGVVNFSLTSSFINSSPSALKVSPFTTTSTTLFAGLRNGRLLKGTFANIAPGWSNISGPGFTGSISDIEFGQNEQEIFVTIHNYGVQSIWYTSNGGATWRSLEGNLPDLPVKCILQNPLIPNELIIGTELGIWATADFTVTNPIWVPSYNGMSDVTVLDLDLRASDNTILATTHGRGLFTGQFTANPLSVQENDVADRNISIFPTISNGTVSVASSVNSGIIKLEIYNMSGQKVFNTSIDLSLGTKKLSLQLSSGAYLVKFDGNNFTETKRIVIK